jgi:hypothetical protein
MMNTQPGISTFVKRCAPLHRHATPVWGGRDLADTVDGDRAPPHRCDRKAISRTKNGGRRARTYRPPTAGVHAADSRFGSPALVIDKPVYSAFAGHLLHDELMRRHSDTLILTGAETDVCVLSTALGAIDHGYRVIIAEDAVCSSSDQGHDSLLALFAQRFSHQPEIADTQTILTAWAVV